MDPHHKALLEAASDAEKLAQEIIEMKYELTDLGRQQASNMEALAQYRPHKKHHINAATDKVWVCQGEFFLKMPAQDAKDMLQTDQKTIGTMKEKLRKEMKRKIKSLHKLRPSAIDAPSVRLVLAAGDSLAEDEPCDGDGVPHWYDWHHGDGDGDGGDHQLTNGQGINQIYQIILLL